MTTSRSSPRTRTIAALSQLGMSEFGADQVIGRLKLADLALVDAAELERLRLAERVAEAQLAYWGGSMPDDPATWSALEAYRAAKEGR
jgi:hypothetical protein